MSLKFSSAPEASHIIRILSGELGICTVVLDSTAPTGDYYIQFHDNHALPAEGSSAFLCAPLKVQHVSGTDDGPYVFDFLSERCADGCTVVLSSTRATKTISGAYLVVIGADGT